jgi:cyclopropane fatty-acyl-phospholipid synthase-like methyltransferase
MHDVNYHHHHELQQHEFLGCCKDCRRSLEIIKPHVMAFAEKIKQYDQVALRALDPDDLYRLFLLLDDLAHMEAGEHLAGLILDEPEIKDALPMIRTYYDTFFSIHEVHLAEKLLLTSAPWATLESFPLYPRYEALVKNQIELNNLEDGGRLAFIGCGPVPSSLILLNHLAGIRSVGLDISRDTVALSRQVVQSLGLEKEIDIVHGDETLLEELDWDAILVAAMAMPKKRIFGNLRRIMQEKGKTDARVFFRTYTGMRAILHAPVTADEIEGFTIVGRFFPMGRVNNTVVVAKLEE